MTPPAYRSIRINLLFVAAYIAILLCLIAVVWLSDISEYAQGVITLIIGRFLGYVDQVYAFEFGTTSGSKTKDQTISTMASGSVPAKPPSAPDIQPTKEVTP